MHTKSGRTHEKNTIFAKDSLFVHFSKKKQKQFFSVDLIKKNLYESVKWIAAFFALAGVRVCVLCVGCLFFGLVLANFHH